MQIQTLLLIIGAALIALGVALFQYFYKATYKTKRNRVFALLRFLTVFGLLVLLINPKYTKTSYYTQKPSLAIAVDNSISIQHLGYDDEVGETLERFRESEPLNTTFDIQYYQFGQELAPLDSLKFDQKQTNINAIFKNLEDIYGSDIAPVILVSDGNQTFGESYQYTSRFYEQQVYPLVVGDTITYDDLRLGQINVNRYGYINNKFPVEIFASYKGAGAISSKLVITSKDRVVYSEAVQFSQEKSSRVFNIVLPAERVGVQQYTISLTPISTEKNKNNNSKNFAIEIIDQKTNILVVSSIAHPDVGMLKKSIESNKLRTVRFSSPEEAAALLNEYELVILYQPTPSFEAVFKEMDRLSKNYMLITGPKTNWNALNRYQSVITHEVTGQDDVVQGTLNSNFSTFLMQDIGISDFPPLVTSFGDVQFTAEFDVAIFQKIGALTTENPLVATTEVDGRRGVYILGEGLWKWRAATYVAKRSFEDFDNFLDNLVQYAASDKKKSRLNIEYESFYYGNSSVKLYAQYFDKNYTFDARASLAITAINQETKTRTEVPMLLQRSTYEVDLSNLEPGTYNFTIAVDGQGLARSGTFTIVPFEIEQQFLNAALQPLQEVAQNTDASLHILDQYQDLINTLIDDKRYLPIQKSTENIVPLIDWKWVLAVIAILLAIEWFLRKYNGLT